MNSLQTTINVLINDSIKGIHTYRYKDTTWLIFTDEVKWVIELTDGGTLWFNFKYFENLFKYVSLDINDENIQYITAWAESYFFKPTEERVYSTKSDNDDRKRVFYNQAYRNGYVGVADVIGEGIKESVGGTLDGKYIDWIIDEGEFIKTTGTNLIYEYVSGKKYKLINPSCPANNTEIHMIISDGIKNTYPDKNGIDYDWSDEFKAEKVLLNGNKI